MKTTIYRFIFAISTILVLLILFFYLRNKSAIDDDSIFFKGKIVKVKKISRQGLEYEVRNNQNLFVVIDEITRFRGNIVTIGDSIIKNGPDVIFKKNDSIMFIYRDVKNSIFLSVTSPIGLP